MSRAVMAIGPVITRRATGGDITRRGIVATGRTNILAVVTVTVRIDHMATARMAIGAAMAIARGRITGTDRATPYLKETEHA